MKEKIYVHVADDHKILIEGIIAVINTDEDIETIGYSLTGKEVIDWVNNKDNKADVLILDITMPVLDGIEVLTYFKERNIKQKVIILSSYDDVKIVQEMLSLGCKGYITKNNAGEHIIEGIKAVHRGEQYFSSDLHKDLIDILSGHKLIVDGEMPEDMLLEELTERELKVLRLISKEYNTTEIADMLNLAISTVKTYRKSLLRKLKVKNVVGLVMYAMKHKII